jgi:FxsC-like protein
MSYWFFLSYAHSKQDKRDTGFVEKFFEDLCVEVGEATGDDADKCGFLDCYNLRAGDTWKDELALAVRTARTFVCLMNARYFDRKYCGREWALFENRCKALEGIANRKPKLIIPVLWQTPIEGDFPGFAKDIQFGVSTEEILQEERRLISDLNEKGLRFVAQRRGTTHANAYLACKEQLAEQIVRRATRHVLPDLPKAELPAIDKIVPKFPECGDVFPQPENEEQASSIKASFAVVAAKRNEVPLALGDLCNAYSNDAEEWVPFHPESGRQFFLMAQAQANENRLKCEWVNVDKQLVQHLQEAEDRKSIVIMVVDPVTARLPQYSAILKEFDRYIFRNCVVLIPWSGHEPETDATKNAVEAALRRRFETQRERYLRTNITTAEELENEISMAIKDLGEILAAHRKPQRTLAEGRFESPPSLAPV